MWSVGIFPWERTELVFTVAPNTAAQVNGRLAEDSVEAGRLGGLIRNLFHMLGVKRVDLGVKRLPSVLWQSNLSPMNH